MDRLFVHSAHSGYYLKRTANGAAMVVKNNIEVRILQMQGIWHLQVVDGHDAASWLDTLVEFDFLASWYLEMRDYIEVASNPKVFKLEHQGVKAQPLPEATVAMVGFAATTIITKSRTHRGFGFFMRTLCTHFSSAVL